MIEKPERYIADFANAGADWLCVQVEACVHLHRTLQLIKEHGAKAGVALNPSTPLKSIQWVFDDLDYVEIMSVNPGFGGQAFIPSSLEKIRSLRQMIQDRGTNTLIQVDGGVNEKTIQDVSEAGADVFVAGSAIFGSPDYKATIDGFRNKIE
jgi:ribulose-phosphate 3-epimerase